MLYIKDDFYSNFTAISKSNDTMAMKGIMIDQLSNLIADRRGDVIDVLIKSGIKVSKTPSNKEIVEAIVKNMKTNKKMVVGLSYLIAKQNDILQSEYKMNRDSDFEGEGTKQKKDLTKFADTTKTIADTFSVTADALVGAKSGAFQDELLTQTNSKSPEQLTEDVKQRQAQEVARRKRTRNIWLIIGLVAVGGGIYWAYRKGYFKKKGNAIINN